MWVHFFQLWLSHNFIFISHSVTLLQLQYCNFIRWYTRIESAIALKNITSCLVSENKLNKNKKCFNCSRWRHTFHLSNMTKFCICVCVFTKTIVTRPQQNSVWTACGAWNRLGQSARVKKTNWMKPLLVLISFERVSFLLLHKSKPVLPLDGGQVNMPRLTLILSAFPHHL